MEIRAESMTVQQMRTFCSVYEHGGYSSAEKHLGLAGPTLWEHVKTLEMIYRRIFFERTGRNVRPTPEGHALYQLLIPLLASIESTFEVIWKEAGNLARHVTTRSLAQDLGSVNIVAAYRTGRLLTKVIRELLDLMKLTNVAQAASL